MGARIMSNRQSLLVELSSLLPGRLYLSDFFGGSMDYISTNTHSMGGV